MTTNSAIVELSEAIFNRIKEAHKRVYLDRAPEKDPATGKAVRFPYVCYRLPSSTQRELPEEFFLEVDCWDNRADAIRLENLAAAVDCKLHGWNYISDQFGLRVFRVNRLNVRDPDPKIRRRLLRYLVRVYFIT